MRAREPDHEGYVERNGVKLGYEVFGEGDQTVLLLPTWSIVPSRHWKAQVPYLARHYRVVTFDGRGSGRSDRPRGAEAYTHVEFAADTLAVMDATGTDAAMLVALSCGTLWGVQLAADHPERVTGLVAIGPAVPLAPGLPERRVHSWDDRLETTEGWAKYNRHYWRTDYRDFLEFFFSRMFTEPHSTKQIEDCVGWGLEIDPETLIASKGGLDACGLESFRSVCERVRVPVLVIHGDEDAIRSHAAGAALAEITGGRLVTMTGAGHGPHARDPVTVNLLIREFAESLAPATGIRTWTRARNRRKRALYVSSPIGLGHARRDVAIARELRALHPDLQIDWLAQHPVTRVLEDEGERIHPASAHLASESAHIESEAAEHDLHCFQAWRRMDEILVANFMLFHDVVSDGRYDLVIGDEAWDVDYFLHEEPNLKRFAYVWATDFVGWLPMPDGGQREADLTADYNAEMISQIARYPRIRDRALFVGNDTDIVPERFGPELPLIRDWTRTHFDFTGYITGFDQDELADREGLRAALGYAHDEQVCLVTVGGSGVGADLLRRVIAAFPEARRRVPDLRMVVVSGPRIDPAALPRHDGLELRSYVGNLYRHLAACDLAIVQGGLTTAMELTTNRRPFLYFPLRHHFEQNFHVAHRLGRYGAGRRMDYATSTPAVIADAIADEIGRAVTYKPVESDGASRAAALIAELL